MAGKRSDVERVKTTGRSSEQRTEEDRGASEQRGGYLGFVAHEVRNPLSTALWSAELLVRMSAADRGGARGEKLTAMCLRSLTRVRQLIEDHFLCERLDARGIPVRPEVVALREVLDEVVSRRVSDAPPLELRVDGDLRVQADRVLLDRTLDALLSAAGREGSPIRVLASGNGDHVLVRFEGHPPGPDALEDPRKGSPGDPKGHSLSLPLARRAAEALGGTLRVHGPALMLEIPSPDTDRAGVDPTAAP